MLINNEFKYNLNFILKLAETSNNINFDWNYNLIQKLALEVGAPTYKKTPIFKKKYKYRKNDNNISVSEWEDIRNFKTTEIKEKEGVDIILGKIKTEMFKLTDKTYESQKNNIIEILTEVDKSSTLDINDKNKIINLIFNIASTNLFYSKVYAKIYNELNNIFNLVNDNFRDNINNFLLKLKKLNIKFDKDDYDKLCDVNKENDNRIATVIFFVNLMNEKLIEEKVIVKLILELQDYLIELINKENEKEKVEHISDILSEIIKNSYLKLNNNINWNKITENVNKIKNLNISENCSLTNKSIFIHMDIYDIINN